jgi:phosphoserine phosphatase
LRGVVDLVEVLIDKIKLAIFDLDGTIAEPASVWHYICRELDQWETVGSRITEQYNHHKIDYKGFAKLFAASWKNIKYSYFKRIVDQIEYMPGAREAVKKLKSNKVKTALISAGLNVLAERIARELEFDYYYANKLQVNNKGRLSGKIDTCVMYEDKARITEELIKELRIAASQVLGVGDSESDLYVFRKVGTSIAFNPYPHGRDITQAATYTVRSNNLSDILLLLEKK